MNLGHKIFRWASFALHRFVAASKFAASRRHSNLASINHVLPFFSAFIHPMYIFYLKFSDGHKRTLSVSDEATEPAKKPKIEEDTKLEQDIKVEFNNSIKKTLKKLSREVCSIL